MSLKLLTKPVPPKVFGTLLTNIVKKGLCCGCGNCVAACPVMALTMKEELPAITGICVTCEICYYQCPKVDFPYERYEEILFGRRRRNDEPIGVVREVYTARATSEEFRSRGTDGGVVTALLSYLLKSGTVDGAVVCGVDPKDYWKATPILAVSDKDLIEAAGTKYTSAPMMLGLAEAVRDYGKESLAFVGTGCRIEALRKSQFEEKNYYWWGKRVKVAIGLFCFESFHDKILREYLPAKGINLSEVSKFHITKGRFFVYSGNKILLKAPLKEVAQYAFSSCSTCANVTNEYADISVGGAGSPDGWNTVILRSETGEKLFKAAVEAGFIEASAISNEGLEAVIKLAGLKKKKEH